MPKSICSWYHLREKFLQTLRQDKAWPLENVQSRIRTRLHTCWNAISRGVKIQIERSQGKAFLGTFEWYDKHFLVYTLCLMLSVYHIIRMFPERLFLATVLFGFLLRVKLHFSKYAIWFGFCFAHSPMVKPYLVSTFEGTFLEGDITSRLIWASILPLFSLYYYCYTRYLSNMSSSPFKHFQVLKDMAYQKMVAFN
jgi:hypothetical protein